DSCALPSSSQISIDRGRCHALFQRVHCREPLLQIRNGVDIQVDPEPGARADLSQVSGRSRPSREPPRPRFPTFVMLIRTVGRTGTWVAISSFIADYEKSLACSGLKRGARLYEQVILANGYLLEMHFIGTVVQTPTMRPDGTSSISFPFDFGGDANPVFRCRL